MLCLRKYLITITYPSESAISRKLRKCLSFVFSRKKDYSTAVKSTRSWHLTVRATFLLTIISCTNLLPGNKVIYYQIPETRIRFSFVWMELACAKSVFFRWPHYKYVYLTFFFLLYRRSRSFMLWQTKSSEPNVCKKGFFYF